MTLELTTINRYAMNLLSIPAKSSPLLHLPPPNSSTQKQPSRSLSVKLKSTDSHLIIDRINGGRLHEAVSTLDSMARSGSHPDLITYSLLLKSCIRSREFSLGKRVHQMLAESGLEFDSVLLNSLISLYSKRSDTVEEAEQVFDSMGGKRDLVSWSAMISCYANNGMQWKAIGLFLDMLEAGFVPNDYCYSAVIRACSVPETAELGNVVFGFLIKSGYLDSNVNVGCGLIDLFVKGMGGDISSALKVFDRMPEKNVVSCTLMITRLTEHGLPREAVDIFLDMLLEGYMPDKFTITSIMSSCSELGLLLLGLQLHSWSLRSGLALDVCVGCSLVDMYRKCGSLNDSRKVFDSMSDQNVMSWTAMITGYSQSENAEEAVRLYSRMVEGPIRPNHFTLSAALKACSAVSNVATGMQVYAQAVKFGFSSENYVGNSLINMFSRSGKMDDARKAFDALFQKSLVSYNTIVNAYTKNASSEESFVLLHEIEDRGVASSPYMYASLLSATASVGAISKGEQIHARVLKTCLISNQIVGNSLISMYSKCGNVEAAFQVFTDLPGKNVVSWTSMITGFAKHGFGTRALETFNRMLESSTVRPNEVTYVAVLSACSHVGLVSEGWRHFKSMQKEHGIVPKMEHYACMVDLLGRSGLLPEALEFIQQMPFAADTLVWRTFLGACLVHGNIELGKHGARMILERDPNDPAAYVLLANLHARLNQWEEVADLRKKMKQKNLSKEAGCSWIEVKNTVHRFYVGDTLHPRAKEIFDELDRIVAKIKQLGYVPNTDLFLHDVEEEQKEQYLLQHSEKIAVAFGLISSSSGTPIRVFKNLRVCGDCHSAIKYISKATGREIVVRDANRFHHFRGGRCSCNDYW